MNRCNTDLKKMHEDIIKAANVAEVPYDEEVIKKVLKAYGEFFSGTAVTFVTSTKPKEKRALSIRYVELQVPHDPFLIARSNGLLEVDNHPIFDFLSNVQKTYPIMGYGVDVDVNYGVAKIWTAYQIPQPLERAYAEKNAPSCIKNYATYFSKYDFHVFHLYAFDFRSRSVNVYFMVTKEGFFTPQKVVEMIEGVDLKLPPQEVIDHCAKALTIYYTFSWESDVVERVCFGTAVDSPNLVPTHLHPIMKKYVRGAPFQTEKRKFIYSITLSRTGYYIKIENDYNGAMIDMMKTGIQAEIWMDDLKAKYEKELQPKVVELENVKWEEGIPTLFKKITDGIPEAFRQFVKPMLLEKAENKCALRKGGGISESDLVTAMFEITPEPFKPDMLNNLKNAGVNLKKYL